jgi:hypothetical protein
VSVWIVAASGGAVVSSAIVVMLSRFRCGDSDGHVVQTWAPDPIGRSGLLRRPLRLREAGQHAPLAVAASRCWDCWPACFIAPGVAGIGLQRWWGTTLTVHCRIA